MKSALDSNATAGGDAQAGALATPGGGPSPAEAPRACPDCGASSGRPNPQGDGWQCGACSACNPVCSGCNKVVRVTVQRLCVACNKKAAASEGDSGPQAATPVGESRRDCTCGAWYAPPEARRRCAPGCPASVTDQRAGQVASVTSPAGAPSPATGDGRSGPQAAGAVPLPPAAPVGDDKLTLDERTQVDEELAMLLGGLVERGELSAEEMERWQRVDTDLRLARGALRHRRVMREQRDKAWHDHAATHRELEALRRQARQEIQKLEGTKARLEEELRIATARQAQPDRLGAVRAALALLAPHQPSQAETPAGWSARARQGDPEALIYNAILSLDGALQHLAAPEQTRGKGGA